MDNKKVLVFGPIEELPQLFKGCDRVVELGDGYSLVCSQALEAAGQEFGSL